MKFRPADVVSLLLQEEAEKSYREIVEAASRLRVRVERYRSRHDLYRALNLSPSEGQRNIAARVWRYPLKSFETQWNVLFEKESLPPAICALDSLMDPHNVGALLRSAYAFGIKVALIPEWRSSPITATVANVAVGTIEQMELLEVGNLKRALRNLKEKNYLVIGMEPQGGRTFEVVEKGDRVILLLGSEGEGLGPSIVKECDFLVTIPMVDQEICLNASVAGGIALYEVAKRLELLLVDTPK